MLVENQEYYQKFPRVHDISIKTINLRIFQLVWIFLETFTRRENCGHTLEHVRSMPYGREVVLQLFEYEAPLTEYSLDTPIFTRRPKVRKCTRNKLSTFKITIYKHFVGSIKQWIPVLLSFFHSSMGKEMIILVFSSLQMWECAEFYTIVYLSSYCTPCRYILCASYSLGNPKIFVACESLAFAFYMYSTRYKLFYHHSLPLTTFVVI